LPISLENLLKISLVNLTVKIMTKNILMRCKYHLGLTADKVTQCR
jgi:hypothetical protein